MHDAPFPPRTRGTTLLELLVALAVLGILVGLAVPPWKAARDRDAVRGAAADVGATLSLAREHAVLRGGAGVTLDTAHGELVVQVRGSEVLRRSLGGRFGVTLRATRDSLAYDARGLGHGASNLRLVLRRGAAAETVVVARLGRVR